MRIAWKNGDYISRSHLNEDHFKPSGRDGEKSHDFSFFSAGNAQCEHQRHELYSLLCFTCSERAGLKWDKVIHKENFQSQKVEVTVRNRQCDGELCNASSESTTNVFSLLEVLETTHGGYSTNFL